MIRCYCMVDEIEFFLVIFLGVMYEGFWGNGEIYWVGGDLVGIWF